MPIGVEGEQDEAVEHGTPELHPLTGEVAARAVRSPELGELGVAERAIATDEPITGTQDLLLAFLGDGVGLRRDRQKREHAEDGLHHGS